MTEDSLISDLDSLESRKGPQPMTCQWWADQPEDVLEAVRRNVRAKGHTLITQFLRDQKKARVTAPGIRDHVAGQCQTCQTS